MGALGQGHRAGGELYLVGIGPGRPEHLTGRAVEVLRRCRTIVGYQLYLDQVRPWLEPSSEPSRRDSQPTDSADVDDGLGARSSKHEIRFITSRLTEERARAECAVDLARLGERVALISSGDAGIYGLAGLAFEILDEHSWDGENPAVEVVPGVTAAQAAAAVLGAPLMSDFAAISLSDLLTPWDVIERRIAAVASADFTVAIYNPTSRRRRKHIQRAASLLRRHRPAETPVGIVRNALREGQQTLVTTLERLACGQANCTLSADDCAARPAEAPFCIPHRVDMLSLVIVGNSATIAIAGRLVTRRGYRRDQGSGVGDGCDP